jgi:hypothetical protein
VAQATSLMNIVVEMSQQPGTAHQVSAPSHEAGSFGRFTPFYRGFGWRMEGELYTYPEEPPFNAYNQVEDLCLI